MCGGSVVGEGLYAVLTNDWVEPVYVSETVEQTMNPTFRHVDWSACGPGVLRKGQLTCKFWVKSAKMERWRCLLELLVDLQNLQYLGKSVRCEFRCISKTKANGSRSTTTTTHSPPTPSSSPSQTASTPLTSLAHD